MIEYKKVLAPVDTTTTTSLEIANNTSRTFSRSLEGADNIFVDFSSIISPEGDFKRLSGINVLINSIRNLLMTPIGTYPFNPLYGSTLYKMIFDLADNDTEDEIIAEVVDRIREWDDRLEITDVDTGFFSDRKGFRLSITIQTGEETASTSLDFIESHTDLLGEV